MKLTKIFRALLLAAGLAPACATAQTTDALVATLQHGDETKVFTGTDAFINAYNAAADSADIITLSSGRFAEVHKIEKSITVYGAGFEEDTITGAKPTILFDNSSGQNWMRIMHKKVEIEDEDGYKQQTIQKSDGCKFEGILFSDIVNITHNSLGVEHRNIHFVKCKFNSSMYLDNNIYNLLISQCVFDDGINKTAGTLYNSLITNSIIQGSYILDLRNNSDDGDNKNTLLVDHCILCHTGTSSYEHIRGTCTCTNSILILNNNYLSTNTVTYKNNIIIGTNNIVEDCWTGLAKKSVFASAEEDGSYAANRTFELKYPNKYIGTDGTQVGVHGGRYPWNKIPATPRIVESNIDTETSAEGKLKVSIKVEAH
ncbi:MAG: hypothetical protein IKD38_02250 [Bacteroidaceae bacterium]|nr:hypothetical protein [Bacteroidaceae bacterium]